MPKSFKTPEKAAKMEQIVLKKTDSSSPDSSKQVKQEYLELFKTASDLTT